MEDIKKTANEQAAEETKEAVKVVTDSDTPEGAYVHEFTKRDFPYKRENLRNDIIRQPCLKRLSKD